MNRLNLFSNEAYKDEAATLFSDMMRAGADPKKLLPRICQIRDRANGNQDLIMAGIREFHKQAMNYVESV